LISTFTHTHTRIIYIYINIHKITKKVNPYHISCYFKDLHASFSFFFSNCKVLYFFLWNNKQLFDIIKFYYILLITNHNTFFFFFFFFFPIFIIISIYLQHRQKYTTVIKNIHYIMVLKFINSYIEKWKNKII
jgi:hypothetical protein